MSEAAVGSPAAGEPTTHHGPRLNASVVVIVVILSVVLILSGLLHLLARCLGRRRATRVARGVPVSEHSPLVSALHGQLQQLFHMHDAGVEQAFIDTLPVFAYGSIRGLKDSTDCAVCLTEFGDDDRLRLLPKCKHAFHLDCIDTWLLSNSTCPLCRRSLLPDPLGEPSTSANPLLSPPDQPSSRRIISHQNSLRICAAPSSSDSDESEIQEIEEVQTTETPSPFAPTIRVMDAHGAPRVLKVELGRVAGSETRKLTSKGARSYSMGSYEYVVNPASWELAPATNKPTHRSALSDSIPELGVDNELFWASRGLYNPQTLARVRELLTPIESEGFSPFVDSGYSPGWIDIDIERGEIVEESTPDQSASDIKVRSSSLSRLPTQSSTTVDTSCFRRSFSAGMIKNTETLKLQASVATATSSIFDETLILQGSFSRRFSLHWLMGRDKRMVFAAPISI